MKARIKSLLKRIRHRITAKPVRRVPHYWVKGPPVCTGRDVCIFVTYARGGSVPDHARIHIRGWQAAGFDVILVACLDDLDAGLQQGVEGVAGLMLRANEGYDFGAWANAISSLPTLPSVRLCITANDSVYGPLHDLHDLARRMVATGADFIGLVDSRETTPHYQSFLLAFTPAAMKSRFWKFWFHVGVGGREDVIQYYELRLLDRARRAGLRTAALYSGTKPVNPTLTDWRSLVDDGFPYIKVQLLRDNPNQVDIAAWRTVMADHGYDAQIVDRHLSGRLAGS